MMRKLLIISTAIWAISSLTGCDLYYGTPNDRNCDIWGCDGEPVPVDPIAPGGECRFDEQCAAGCYCDGQAGVCIETGFCDTSRDCPGEFTCDDRATCVPLDRNDCFDGSCDPEPPPVPESCTEDDQCLAGCFCNLEGMCQETGFCDSDADCMDIINEDGTTQEAVCEPNRNTCIPAPPGPTATCNEGITCAEAAPTCADDATPAILDGCYTGDCILRADCDVPPLAQCDRILNPAQCQGRMDCVVAYDGMDCTCGGSACDCANPPLDPNGNPLECTCATWEPRCESI